MKPFGLSASVLALAITASAGCATTQPSTPVVTTTPGTVVVMTPNDLDCAGAYSATTGTNFGACVAPQTTVARVAPAERTATRGRPATTDRSAAMVTPAPGTPVVTPAPSATVVTTQLTCAGAYSPYTGTNFGACVYPGR